MTTRHQNSVQPGPFQAMAPVTPDGFCHPCLPGLWEYCNRKMKPTWISPSCLLTNHGFRITLTDIDLMQAHEKPEKNQ
jgi:hypothetical protein